MVNLQAMEAACDGSHRKSRNDRSRGAALLGRRLTSKTKKRGKANRNNGLPLFFRHVCYREGRFRKFCEVEHLMQEWSSNSIESPFLNQDAW